MKYEKFIEQYKQGKLSIHVNRSMARKFYTRIPLSIIQKETGEAPRFEKLVIWLAYLIAPVALMASLALGFLAFGWWGFVSLILGLGIYALFSSASLNHNSRLLEISLLLIITIAIHLLSGNQYPQLTKFACFFIFSLWCNRFAYCVSVYFLKNFVLRNEKAYGYLSKYLDVKLLD